MVQELTLNIIGAGRVGRTLGRLISDANLVTIQDVFNTQANRANESVVFIGAGRPVSSITAIRPATITLITAPDDAIVRVCQRLCEAEKIQPSQFVVHMSGALGSEVLAKAQSMGAYIASAHPLKSFASPKAAIQDFAGTFCALEGDPPAVEVMQALLSALGAHVSEINPNDKVLYHAAAVMACGGLTALFATCVNMLEKAGMSDAQAKAMLEPYMAQTLKNNAELGSSAALTGPVARGDNDIIAKHLACLKDTNPLAASLYEALTRLGEGLIAK